MTGDRAMTLRRRYDILALALLLAGCGTSQPFRIHGLAEHLPAKVEIDNVPFFPQEAFHCGPASLAAALAWSGVPLRPEDLVAQVYSPARRGSLPTDMLSAIRRHARIAYPVSTSSDLLIELAAGYPVIVLQDLGPSWHPRWHFAVAIGYDLHEETIVLHSGTESRQTVSLRHFGRTWKRSGYWALVVVPPSKLPATATERAFLEAVVGLERSRQWEAVAEAYGTALERWPESLGALMGLGNSRYAVGDLRGAEQAFQAATRAHPLTGAAFNNLAQVLAETGRRAEALDAARKAVALGGPLANSYEVTLAEIQAGERH